MSPGHKLGVCFQLLFSLLPALAAAVQDMLLQEKGAAACAWKHVPNQTQNKHL